MYHLDQSRVLLYGASQSFLLNKKQLRRQIQIQEYTYIELYIYCFLWKQKTDIIIKETDVDTVLPHMSDKRPSTESNSKVSSFLNRNFWNLWNKLCQICCHLVWTLKYPDFTILLGFIGGHDFPLHGFVCSWSLKSSYCSNFQFNTPMEERTGKFRKALQKAMYWCPTDV